LLVRTFEGVVFHWASRAVPILTRAITALNLKTPSDLHDLIVRGTLMDLLLAWDVLSTEFGCIVDPPRRLKVPGDYLDWLIRKFA